MDPNAYTYQKMMSDISDLKEQYDFLLVSDIGKSVLGKSLPVIKLGEGSNKIIYNASHHAREWITTPLLIKFLEEFCHSFAKQKPLYGYDTSEVFQNSRLAFIPMVNPDGVDLSINGLSPDDSFRHELLEMNNHLSDFTYWKANIRGVDLNRNYNAKWDKCRAIELCEDISTGCPLGFVGDCPESEPETQALIAFTRNFDPNMVLAFHACGEEIYWNFDNLAPEISLEIANEFALISGYSLINPNIAALSYAGYKDWFIQEFRRPGFTIEVGKDTSPVPLSEFDEIVDKNIRIILCAATY
jgi:g-D-glutamyl-meso-diaminopimelate peptidase